MTPRPMQPDVGKRAGRFSVCSRTMILVVSLPLALRVSGADATVPFHRDVEPILKEFCYDCHGDGAKKGNVAFDELKSADALLDHDLWLKVLRNTRAGLMPPEKKP